MGTQSPHQAMTSGSLPLHARVNKDVIVGFEAIFGCEFSSVMFEE
jgi:hypothetical protein